MKTRTVFQRPSTLAPGNQLGSSHCPTGHCFVSLWQICSQAGFPPGLLYQQMIILFAPKHLFFSFSEGNLCLQIQASISQTYPRCSQIFTNFKICIYESINKNSTFKWPLSISHREACTKGPRKSQYRN